MICVEMLGIGKRKILMDIKNSFECLRHSFFFATLRCVTFLDEEDLHEIVEEILNNSSDYEDLDLVTVMPFYLKRIVMNCL